MVNGEVIRTSGARIASVSNSPRSNISGGGGHRIIKWIFSEEAPLDNSGRPVEGELFIPIVDRSKVKGRFSTKLKSVWC